MWKDFKTFISRGNVVDLAVAVVIGAAFTKIINTVADGLISPLVSLIGGDGLDFKDKFVNMSGQDVTGLTAKEIVEKGLAVFRYGELITDIINFLIVAFIVFLIAHWAGRYFRSLVGSGGFIVIDESIDIVDSTKNLTEFYKHDLCDWCTPCRVRFDSH